MYILLRYIFRAEIGFFYSVSQPEISAAEGIKPSLSEIIFNLMFTSLKSINYRKVPLNVVALILLCLFVPIIFVAVAIINILGAITSRRGINIFYAVSLVYCYLRLVLYFLIFITGHTYVFHKTFFAKTLRPLFHLLFLIMLFVTFKKFTLLLSGDIESNPGPPKADKVFSVCHWNLNGIAANSFAKISLLEAHNAIYDFDMICLSETFLNSDYQNDDKRLDLQGYDLIRSDHPSNTKQGGVCIYYKEHLSIKKGDDINSLNECLVCEISNKKTKSFITCVYRSPSQTNEELTEFYNSFETICSNIALESPLCSLILGDFNAIKYQMVA